MSGKGSKPNKEVPTSKGKRSKAESSKSSQQPPHKKKKVSQLAQLFAPQIEEDNESYSAEGQQADDSFDDDFFDPESDDGAGGI